ncbi:carbohydrate-binding protein [Kitasatospora sp. NPDC093679]|uniref:carbohydrate-binding protein n=1 Tax=Kitasatospora sp. NPDC093679 TaxID=3154983 RepID=UPI0034157118
MDFGDGATRVELTAAREGAGPAAVELQLAGSVTRIEVPAAGGRHAWATVRADLAAPAKGVHELRIVLRGALRSAEAAFG